MTALTKSSAFFDYLRASKMFGTSLEQFEVDGVNAILKACGAAHWGVGYVAYAVATAYHETAKTMQPIKEYGSNAYLSKYDTGELAKRLGNTTTADGDGILYCGRGYVQLTGHANYEKAGKALGVDLLKHPDLALRDDLAAQIMVLGMGGGWFTGKMLSSYLIPGSTGTVHQFVNCRRIINSLDRAELIAGYAIEFQRALIIGGWQ